MLITAYVKHIYRLKLKFLKPLQRTSQFNKFSTVVMFKIGTLCYTHMQVAPLSTIFSLLVEGSLLSCSCLVSGQHKLRAFMCFIDDEVESTPDFRGSLFFITNKLWIVQKVHHSTKF